MKTNITSEILKLFFVLFAAILLPATLAAGTPKMAGGLKTVFVMASFAPVIPAEADYSDIPPINEIFSTLQPVTPKVASFDDSGIEAYESWNLVRTLHPDVPAEAGFNEEEIAAPAASNALAPSLPAEADYNDGF